MNTYTSIGRTNVKGQVVIPSKIRTFLGITTDSSLFISLRGRSISISPFQNEHNAKYDKDSYLQILAKTAGMLNMDSSQKISHKRRQLEIAKTKENKRTW